MNSPLLTVRLPSKEARSQLQALGFDLAPVASLRQLARHQAPRPPRLFVVQINAAETDLAQTVLGSLAAHWPLTDVVFWAPRAAGDLVRTLFRGGARDVVVSAEISKLTEAVEAAAARQPILARVNDLGKQRLRGSSFESMLSRSSAMWDLFHLCARIAPADATVLISGETGTGKELMARAIHRLSGRKGRFVAANCASISPELVNSELFGHERGAFTGADRAKRGLVAAAERGSLLLDEIGDMPAEAQQSLLRMLQEKRIRPLGSAHEVAVDVRVIAATNRDLSAAVREQTFREDLLYRLDVIRIQIPPLRQRPEDILLLFGHFTKRLSKHYGLDPPTFTDGFLDALASYAWPGNVRQLENFAERLMLARPSRALGERDFHELQTPAGDSLSDPQSGAAAPSPANVDLNRTLAQNVEPVVERLELAYLQAALRLHHGRIEETARQAGVSRRTLLRKMKQHRLDKKQFKDPAPPETPARDQVNR